MNSRHRHIDVLWIILVLPIVASFHGTNRHPTILTSQCDRNVRLTSSATAVATTSRLSASVSTAEDIAVSSSTTQIIHPDKHFRTTNPGEVSFVTMNVLAPTYHSLSIDQWNERIEFLKQDREERFPLAIRMAKQHNGDILCMQEVEGGTDELESRLKALLAEPITAPDGSKLPGYDKFLWASLLPNRAENVVGNCIAWRSDRHKMVDVDCFKRGMVCQFQEVATDGGTFAVANVHLPARPSNIMGRLATMANTIQKLSSFDTTSRSSPLDGLLVVAGDFNSDQKSVAAKLLTTGSSPYGNLKDRNYKTHVSKLSAFSMKHNYRFKDVYEGNREEAAPVTVSLQGRGPGCMDHLFYAQNLRGRKQTSPSSEPVRAVSSGKPDRTNVSKRKVRRQRVAWMQTRQILQSNAPTAMRTESILATVSGPDDAERLEIINNGLPNVEKGFPSDHIPVGALFVPSSNFANRKEEIDNDDADEEDLTQRTDDNDETFEEEENEEGVPYPFSGARGAVSNSVLKRREAGAASISVRRRHNALLGLVTDWLGKRGAKDIQRDQPLYKLKYTQGVKKLKKKSRAPDLVCVMNDSLVIVEVTISGKPDSARLSKLSKYEDLESILRSAPEVKAAGLKVCPPFVILLDDQGGIPEETKQDIADLAKLTMEEPLDEEAVEMEAQRFCNYLQGVMDTLV